MSQTITATPTTGTPSTGKRTAPASAADRAVKRRRVLDILDAEGKDAVLLTTARILPEFTGQGLARYLLNGVVAALTRRGVRAIELFGHEDAPATTDAGPGSVDADIRGPANCVTCREGFGA